MTLGDDSVGVERAAVTILTLVRILEAADRKVLCARSEECAPLQG